MDGRQEKPSFGNLYLWSWCKKEITLDLIKFFILKNKIIIMFERN